MLLPNTLIRHGGANILHEARTLDFAARLLELMPAASLANPESKDASDMPPVPSPSHAGGGTAPLSHLQDVLLGLILALSLTSLACGLWLWLRFRRGDAGRAHSGAVVLPSHATATVSEASTPGTSASTFSLPSPSPRYPPHAHRILVLGSPPDADGWRVQRRDPDGDEGRGGRASSESEIYAVDIANGRCTWSPSVLYFAGQRLEVTPLPARPVTPPPTSWVPPPGRSKYSPRR